MTPTEILQAHQDERQPVENWTRVMGYHRPVSCFNPGKRAEHRDRKYFRESSIQPERTIHA